MGDLNDKTQNVNIWDDAKTKAVSVITDQNLERLAVDATISGDESPTKYAPRMHIDVAGQVVGLTDVSIFSFSGSPGLLDFIAISSGNASYEVALKIDGIEVYRVSMSDLGVIGLSNAVNVPIWAETANKNFRFNPKEGAGFSSSVEVLARATVGSQTLSHMMLYREKV